MIMILWQSNLHALKKNRNSSAPYLSGDTFRSFADFIFDEATTSFDPQKVKYGDIIFVKTDKLKEFKSSKHQYIKNPYVLITHNADTATPGAFKDLLEDNKILAWYAQNAETLMHPKLIPLPIGIANQYWAHGSCKDLKTAQENTKNTIKTNLAYLNISVGTYRSERQKVYDLFINTTFCLNSKNKPYKQYLEDIASCKFVLSPRGNGIDCHRTWEALYLGSIPIVRTSNIDSIYKDLPVLIINEWEEVTQDYLNEAYRQIQAKTHNLDRLYSPYWEKEFNKFKG